MKYYQNIAKEISNKINISFSVGYHCTSSQMCIEHQRIQKLIYDKMPKNRLMNWLFDILKKN